MLPKGRFAEFLTSDSGSTTADWIVLASGVIGISLGAIIATRSGVNDLGSDISASLMRVALPEEEEEVGPTPVRFVNEYANQGRDTVCSSEGVCLRPSYWRVGIVMDDGSVWALQRWRGGGFNDEFEFDIWRYANTENANMEIMTEVPPSISSYVNARDPFR
ncbi:MAG: hypothetical protein R3D60_06195 [Paracoccaceae bacterium]